MKTFFNRLLPLVLLLVLPAAVQAQFTFTTNNGAITITGYTGPGDDVTIPSTTNDLPVISIGTNAFYNCNSLTGVTIPNSVTSIEDNAFRGCFNLASVTIGNSVTNIGGGAFSICAITSVTIPNSVTSIGPSVFDLCTRLTSVTIPNSVTSIGDHAFGDCMNLASVTIGKGVTNIGAGAFFNCGPLTYVTIPSSVTSIGDSAFSYCRNLTGVYFQGNAPSADSSLFPGDYNNPTVYYLPGTTGWYSPFGGVPAVLWFLPNPLILNNGPSFGVQTNGFGFIISWATNIPVVVEACTNLVNPQWSPVRTNTLSGGSSYFSDPQWANYPARFYRLCSP